jgi:hypothetical protein
MKKSLKTLEQISLLFICANLAVGCSAFLPDRSYIEEMNRESDPLFQAGKDFKVVGGDSGEAYRSKAEVNKRTPASARSKAQTQETESIKQELTQKELDMPEEVVEAYSKDKKYLPTDSDKLYYLSLNIAERKNYVALKKQDMADDLGKNQDFVQKRSIHSNDVYLGMGKSQVVQAWGKPTKVEIAGNPKLQNERWSFMEDGNIRQIYFENGQVQGWALDL